MMEHDANRSKRIRIAANRLPTSAIAEKKKITVLPAAAPVVPLSPPSSPDAGARPSKPKSSKAKTKSGAKTKAAGGKTKAKAKTKAKRSRASSPVDGETDEDENGNGEDDDMVAEAEDKPTTGIEDVPPGHVDKIIAWRWLPADHKRTAAAATTPTAAATSSDSKTVSATATPTATNSNAAVLPAIAIPPASASSSSNDNGSMRPPTSRPSASSSSSSSTMTRTPSSSSSSSVMIPPVARPRSTGRKVLTEWEQKQVAAAAAAEDGKPVDELDDGMPRRRRGRRTKEQVEEAKEQRRKTAEAVAAAKKAARRYRNGGDSDEERADETDEGKEFLVTFRGMSYLHVKWMTTDQVIASGGSALPQYLRAKLNKFLRRHTPPAGDNEDAFPPEFCEVDRILASRPSPDTEDETDLQYLCKWTNLPYSESTWESPSSFKDNTKIDTFMKHNRVPSSASMAAKSKASGNEWKKLEESPSYRGNELRPWQLDGVNWLMNNWVQRRGCILADEMGLGKTVQMVATISHAIEGQSRAPFLIIVPLSTISHWKREFESWTELNTVVFQGTRSDRDLIRHYEWHFQDNEGQDMHVGKYYKFHILVATYESVMSEVVHLSKINWRFIVVDEAHRMKNKSSKLFKTLKLFKSDHRVLLTGTPIQNNLEELWSLLNYIQPKTFASLSAFSKDFGKVSESEQVSKLQHMLSPYLLRRMKEDVAKKIPPKEETIIEVELTMLQKQYYRAVLERNRGFLNKGCVGTNVPKLINVVMQLRKVCNHPYLIEGVEDKATSTLNSDDKPAYLNALLENSGKLTLVDKLLPKLKAGGHKVLIFSQMKMVLDLLEYYMKLKGYIYERIDGSIRGNDRQAAIDRFNRPDTDRFVFMLSTRAGGLGINLATADTVIIYDSDWNPQNDMQAQARCHRIGQTQKVVVYRLVTRRTYEKEMFRRASLKLGLDQAILHKMGERGTGEDGLPSALGLSKSDKKQIESLIKHGAYDLFNEQADQASKSFCDADIDSILKERSTTLTTGGTEDEDDDNTGEVKISGNKTSFTTFSADGDIDMDAPDFWEKVLPDNTSASRLMVRLRSGDAERSDEKQQQFFEDLGLQVQDVISSHQQGVAPPQLEQVLSVLRDVGRNNFFTQERRIQANNWVQEIEHPRRHRRALERWGDKYLSTVKEKKGEKTEMNAYGGAPYTRSERRLLTTAIIAYAGVCPEYCVRDKSGVIVAGSPPSSAPSVANIWLLIRDRAGLNHREMSEVIGYSFAFLDLCAAHSGDDGHIFKSAKEQLSLCIPVNIAELDAVAERDDAAIEANDLIAEMTRVQEEERRARTAAPKRDGRGRKPKGWVAPTKEENDGDTAMDTNGDDKSTIVKTEADQDPTMAATMDTRTDSLRMGSTGSNNGSRHGSRDDPSVKREPSEAASGAIPAAASSSSSIDEIRIPTVEELTEEILKRRRAEFKESGMVRPDPRFTDASMFPSLKEKIFVKHLGKRTKRFARCIVQAKEVRQTLDAHARDKLATIARGAKKAATTETKDVAATSAPAAAATDAPVAVTADGTPILTINTSDTTAATPTITMSVTDAELDSNIIAHLWDDLDVPDRLDRVPVVWWWKPEDDRHLLVGIARHGLSFDDIRSDESLPFFNKCGPIPPTPLPNASKKVPVLPPSNKKQNRRARERERERQRDQERTRKRRQAAAMIAPPTGFVAPLHGDHVLYGEYPSLDRSLANGEQYRGHVAEPRYEVACAKCQRDHMVPHAVLKAYSPPVGLIEDDDEEDDDAPMMVKKPKFPVPTTPIKGRGGITIANGGGLVPPPVNLSILPPVMPPTDPQMSIDEEASRFDSRGWMCDTCRSQKPWPPVRNLEMRVRAVVDSMIKYRRTGIREVPSTPSASSHHATSSSSSGISGNGSYHSHSHSSSHGMVTTPKHRRDDGAGSSAWTRRERYDFARIIARYGGDVMRVRQWSRMASMTRKSAHAIEMYYDRLLRQCEWMVEREKATREGDAAVELAERAREIDEVRSRIEEHAANHARIPAAILYCVCRTPAINHDGTQASDRPLLSCDARMDGCAQYYHLDCVGLTDATIPPSTWNCPLCQPKKDAMAIAAAAIAAATGGVKRKADQMDRVASTKRARITTNPATAEIGSPYDDNDHGTADRERTLYPMNDTERAYSSCTYILEILLHDTTIAAYFTHPLDMATLTVANGGVAVPPMARPMDLSAIQRNHHRHAYPSPYHFACDIRLIITNARSVTQVGSPLYNAAEELEAMFNYAYKLAVPIAIRAKLSSDATAAGLVPSAAALAENDAATAAAAAEPPPSPLLRATSSTTTTSTTPTHATPGTPAPAATTGATPTGTPTTATAAAPSDAASPNGTAAATSTTPTTDGKEEKRERRSSVRPQRFATSVIMSPTLLVSGRPRRTPKVSRPEPVDENLSVAMAVKIMYRTTLLRQINEVMNKSRDVALASLVNVPREELPVWWTPLVDYTLLSLVHRDGLSQEREWVQPLLEAAALPPAVASAEEDTSSLTDKASYLATLCSDMKQLVHRVKLATCIILFAAPEDPTDTLGPLRSLIHDNDGDEEEQEEETPKNKRTISTPRGGSNGLTAFPPGATGTASSSSTAGLTVTTPRAGKRLPTRDELESPQAKKSKPMTPSVQQVARIARNLPRNEHGQVICPFELEGGLTILSLGTIVADRHTYHKEHVIWPLGFTSRRYMSSFRDSRQRTGYTSMIYDQGGAPRFRVIADDAPDEPFESGHASTSWSDLMARIYAQQGLGGKRYTRPSANGPELFGFGDPVVKLLIEELPGVDRLTHFRSQAAAAAAAARNTSVTPIAPATPQVTHATPPDNNDAIAAVSAAALAALGTDGNGNGELSASAIAAATHAAASAAAQQAAMLSLGFSAAQLASPSAQYAMLNSPGYAAAYAAASAAYGLHYPQAFAAATSQPVAPTPTPSPPVPTIPTPIPTPTPVIATTAPILPPAAIVATAPIAVTPASAPPTNDDIDSGTLLDPALLASIVNGQS